MYIDDLLILSEDVDYVSNVKSFFSSEFELKIFQINGICLRIQDIRYKKRKTINLNQINYIKDVFKCFCICKIVNQ